MSVVYPFRPAGRRDIAIFRERLTERIQAWAEEWLGKREYARVVQLLLEEDAVGSLRTKSIERLARWDDDAWCAIVRQPALFGRLGSRLLGSAATSVEFAIEEAGILKELVEEALGALASHVLGSNETAGNADSAMLAGELPGDVRRMPKGACLAELDLAGLRVSLAVSAAIVVPAEQPKGVGEHLASPGSIDGLLDNKMLGFRITLRCDPLTLADLATLRIGDVIRVRQTVHEPLQFSLRDASVDCAGYLGRQGGKLAIRVAGATSMSTNGRM